MFSLKGDVDISIETVSSVCIPLIATHRYCAVVAVAIHIFIR
jgi:hypothetical protein